MAHSSSSHPTSVLESVSKPMPGTVPYHPQPAHSGAAQFAPGYRPAEPLKVKPDKKPESKDELPLSMLPPRLRVGAVARTAAALPGASGLATEPPKVDVNISGCIVANQQQQQAPPPPVRGVGREPPLARPLLTHAQVLQAGIPIPAYEASLVSFTLYLVTLKAWDLVGERISSIKKNKICVFSHWINLKNICLVSFGFY